MKQLYIKLRKAIVSSFKYLKNKGFRLMIMRKMFFDKLKNKYPNLHIFYVFFNVTAVWAGFFILFDSWAVGTNLLAEPIPKFVPEILWRYLNILIIGLILLLLDDLSLKELVFCRKTLSEKSVNNMTFREKIFHNFKCNYPNLSTIYTLIAILLCWCSMFGFFYNIPVQPFIRAIILICGGLFFLYIDDLKLDEI